MRAEEKFAACLKEFLVQDLVASKGLRASEVAEGNLGEGLVRTRYTLLIEIAIFSVIVLASS